MARINLVMEEDFDNYTVSDLKELSKLRISLLSKQLDNIDDFIQDLIDRNLLNSKDVNGYKEELSSILEEKINKLQKFVDSDDLYFDEIEFYLNILT